MDEKTGKTDVADEKTQNAVSSGGDAEWTTAFAFLLAAVNVVGLFIVFGSDTYHAENVMGQLLNAASRTNGLLVLAIVDLVVIGTVLMVRR
jgi:hypothetical protein